MNRDKLVQYARGVEAIRRDLALLRREAQAVKKSQESAAAAGRISKKVLTPRQKAVLNQGMAAWVAQKTELAEGKRYDPGIDFSALGIDWLVVDEAQNMKNLYMPANREGGVPKYMGKGKASKIAWNLDFRAAIIRGHTGGTGICLLSATPAKNSPLEFYNVLQYIDNRVWRNLGIMNPEQFIDRYLKVEPRQTFDSATQDIVTKSAVVGFKNLDELRSVIFRYCDFITAEEAGITLPERKDIPPIFIEMGPRQQEKYDELKVKARAIKKMMGGDDPKQKKILLGIMARMGMVATHIAMDEKHTMKTAVTVDPHSRKIDTCCQYVVKNRNCGHIIFLESLAGHVWVEEALVDFGIDRDRIAMLNAQMAPGSMERQTIARKFNGGINDEFMKDDSLEPEYDVVICNQVAYEGIDLQRRTCEIHHLDFPWEPSTIEQRNGRGVRQGNLLGAIAIRYYASKRSQDQVRLAMIKGKHGWMVSLLKSMDKDTMNPAATMEGDEYEQDALLADDPEKALVFLRAAGEEAKAKALELKVKNWSKDARSISDMYVKSRWALEATDAERFRKQAERKLILLEKNVVSEAWPFMSYVYKAKENRLFVPLGGPPFWNGEHVKIIAANIEIGKVSHRIVEIESSVPQYKTVIGMRRMGSGIWYRYLESNLQPYDKRTNENGMKDPWTPEQINPPWDEDDDTIRTSIKQVMRRDVDAWLELGWRIASEDFLLKWWPEFEEAFQKSYGWRYGGTSEIYQRVPVVINGQLEQLRWSYEIQIVGAPPLANLRTLKSWCEERKIAYPPDFRIIPPTREGFQEFLKLSAPAEHLPLLKALEPACQYWWARSMPKGLITRIRTELKRARVAARMEKAREKAEKAEKKKEGVAKAS